MQFPENKTLPIPYGWYCIGFSDDVAAGEIKRVFYFNREMVLFRGASGELALTEAFCPHLGAHLGVGGVVVGNTIRCPFHGWRFDNEGNCVEIPYAKKIPPRAQGKPCLTSYPVTEVNGIIWAWYHPQGGKALFDVEHMPGMDSGEWTDYQKYTWTINSHVQETGENAVDTAHFKTVHQLSGLTGEPEITFDRHRRISNLKVGLHKINKAGEIVEGEFVDGRIYTACCGPGQTWTIQNTYAEVIIIGLPTPVTGNKLELRFACAMPKKQQGNAGLVAQAIIDNIVIQVQQDIPIWENKIYRNDPILCDGDGPIAQYRKWFKQFYIEH